MIFDGYNDKSDPKVSKCTKTYHIGFRPLNSIEKTQFSASEFKFKKKHLLFARSYLFFLLFPLQDIIHFGQMSMSGNPGASFSCNHPGLWQKSGARSRSGQSFSKYTVTYPMLLNRCACHCCNTICKH